MRKWFFSKKKVCYIHSVEEICVLLISHDYIWERLLFAKANTKKRWCKKIYNFFCVTLSSRRECMNANKFSLVFFFLYLSLLYFSSHQFFYHEFFFFWKKNHITASLGFMFFKDMSPRICTVYLDIFCMYVNKCCFDAMFFLTRKFQSLRILSILAEESLPWWLLKLWWSWWWFEFLFNCWSKQLQTGPSSLVDWYK